MVEKTAIVAANSTIAGMHAEGRPDERAGLRLLVSGYRIRLVLSPDDGAGVAAAVLVLLGVGVEAALGLA